MGTLQEQPQELFHREIKPGMSPHPEDADYPGKAQGEGRSSPELQLFPSSGLEVAAPKRSWWEEGNWANWERAISTARGIFRRGSVAWIYPERLRGNSGLMEMGRKTSRKELDAGFDGKSINRKGWWECGVDFLASAGELKQDFIPAPPFPSFPQDTIPTKFLPPLKRTTSRCLPPPWEKPHAGFSLQKMKKSQVFQAGKGSTQGPTCEMGKSLPEKPRGEMERGKNSR